MPTILTILAVIALIFAVMEFWNVKRAGAIAVLLLAIIAFCQLMPFGGLLG
jgi:hypothetical protein